MKQSQNLQSSLPPGGAVYALAAEEPVPESSKMLSHQLPRHYGAYQMN